MPIGFFRRSFEVVGPGSNLLHLAEVSDLNASGSIFLSKGAQPELVDSTKTAEKKAPLPIQRVEWAGFSNSISPSNMFIVPLDTPCS
jgi:hypothetical protein